MTTPQDELRPEEIAEAAAAAIEDARAHGFRDSARLLAEAGLIGIGALPSEGGLGLDTAFALPIAEAAGRLQLRFPLIEQIVLTRALSATPHGAALLAADRIATVAWHGSLADGVAGHAAHAADCDWVLVAEGVGRRTEPRADTDVADKDVADDGHEAFCTGALLLDLSSVKIETDDALDSECPQYWLGLESAKVLTRIDAAAYARLRREARILYAGFVTGAAEGAIALAAAHVGTRVQFGRPLSANQAVRHLLARMRLLVEASRASARRVLAPDEYGATRDCRPALAGAIDNAAFVLEKAIHLHGGMGFTWDIPLHRSLRDIRKLDAAFGSGALTRQIGRQFIEVAPSRDLAQAEKSS